MKLIFVEHAYQVDDILRKMGDDAGEFIALGPSAIDRLEGKDIAFTIPEDYCPLEGIEEACMSKEKRLIRTCSELDESLSGRDPFLKKWEIRPFQFYFWQVGMLVDAMVGRVAWLKSILDKKPDAEVFVHLAPPQGAGFFGFDFSKQETLWGRLLALPGWKNKVTTFEDRPSFGKKEQGGKFIRRITENLRRDVKGRIVKNPVLAELALNLCHGVPGNWVRRFRPRDNSGYVYMLNSPLEWKSILPDLSGPGTTIRFLDGQMFSSHYDDIDNCVWSSDTEALFLRFREGLIEDKDEVDFTPILKDRICWIIENSPRIAGKIIRQMEKTSSTGRDKGVLTSITTDMCYSTQVIKQFFFKKDVPVINWQYGAVWSDGRITQRADHLNMLSTDTVFVYGDGVKRAYESSAFGGDCSVRSIGSAKLDMLEKKNIKAKGSSRRSILYVVTNYYRNGWYCGFSPPFSDRIYYQEQHVIIDRLTGLAERMEGLDVTVKLYARADILGEDPPWVDNIKDIRNISITRSSGFSDFLGSADMVVVDSPTTTLLEALTTRLPVFVLTSVVSPPRGDLGDLKKRAVCGANAKELMDALEEYINTGHFPADVDDRSFLDLYGTCAGDGKSRERARGEIGVLLLGQNIVKERNTTKIGE